MTFTIVSAFLTYTLITAFTPGPNNILALSSAHNYGFRRSIRVLSGMGTGFLIIMLLCALCTYTLIHLMPQVTHWLTWFGAVYIIWLAIKIARTHPARQKTAVEPVSFWTSFMLQFANVKIIFYGITALSTFVLPYTNNPVQVISISVLLAIIGAFGNLCWAVMGHLFQKVFQQHGRIVNLFLAAMLMGVATDMFIRG